MAKQPKELFVEKRGDKYVVLPRPKGEVLKSASRQGDAGDWAKRKHPGVPVLAERVRDTDKGHRDKWRRL